MSALGGATRVLALAAVLALTLVGGNASATLPGKNGPLLISTFIKKGSPNYSTYLYKETLAGKAKKLLGSVETSFYDGAVSPNGRRIVYSRYPGYQLWLGPFANPGKAKAITELDPELNNGDSVFAPDGKSIYYSATYYTGAGVGWHLRRYSLETGKTRSYELDPQTNLGPADVSPNGRLLTYGHGSDEDESAIRFLDTRTGKSRAFKFKSPTLGGSFSPDGRSIAFTSPVKDAWEVYVARLDGKGVRRLTRGLKVNLSPVFSPDGRQVAFTQGTDAYKRIGIVTLKTGKVKYVKAPGDYTKVDQWLRR
ncbi:MAG: PD40 domain-containing protein [Solirubrobacterales bacterium]|nr:PD40 domain-containing protein [Solirubrobacterales bacterium]